MNRLFVVGRLGERIPAERDEALRIEKLLHEIPTLAEWTPLFIVARDILKEKIPATISSVRLLWNAERVEKETPYGIEVLATYPIFELRKSKRNTRTSLKQFRFLRAPFYIKAPDTYSNTIGGPHK